MMLLTILALAIFYPTAYSLSCLQCDNVPKPRHCKAVTQCYDNEICGVEKISDSFGVQLYNVGCMQKSKCLQSNITHHCIECCSSDLCNANGCGETGYSQIRGPVCYDCPVTANPKFCHSIDICGQGEVCMFDARREFGDLLFSSRCSDIHACRQGVTYETAIVGRDLGDFSERSEIDARSVTEHVCRQCCNTDLCNKGCNGSDVLGPCGSMPCVHGICHETHDDFFCECEQGFGGKECNVSNDFCQFSPCYHGQCYNGGDSYICVCDVGFTGKQCNASSSHCRSNPCYHGQCGDVSGGFICACDDGFQGKQCNISTSHCRSNPCYHGQCGDVSGGYICACDNGFKGKQCNVSTYANDCYDLRHLNNTAKSGVYTISLKHKTVEVYCDMDTDGGGWTVFQTRFNGSVNFTRSFVEYEKGFGSVYGEFWLGLESIQDMVANSTSELRLDLTAADGSNAYEIFPNFHLGASPGYMLHIDNGTGTAGDSSGLSYNSGYNFFTYDRDNSNNCAKRDHGGWWYGNCAYANLNGEYISPGTASSSNYGEGGFTYYEFQRNNALKESRMMFRKV